MAKFKLGDRVTIEVNKKGAGRRGGTKAARDTHYGASRRIEDPEDNEGTGNILLIDAAMQWRDVADDGHLVVSQGDANPLPAGVMCYVDQSQYFDGNTQNFYIPDLTDGKVALHALAYQNTIFILNDVKLPPFSGTAYRAIDRGMPLPARGINTLNLSVKLGGRTFLIKEGNPLRRLTPAQTRLDAAIERGADDATIAALTQEVHESSFANATNICRAGVDPQLWFTSVERDQREFWRDYGIFKPRIASGNYLLAVASPIHFEPWDLNNADDYKIVKRLDGMTAATIASPEVPARRLQINQASKRVKVWLVPQLWHFVITYTQHNRDLWRNIHDSTLNPVLYTTEETDAGYMPAFASPMVVNGWETPINGSTADFTNAPAYLHAFGDTAYDPTDTSDASFLRLMMQLSSWWSSAFNLNNQHEPDQAAHTDPPGDPGDFEYQETDVIARSDAVATVTQEGAPAKMLVGGIEYEADDDKRYYIFRKTARVVDTVTIYSGPFDHPAYTPPSFFTGLAGLFVATFPFSAGFSGVYPDQRWAWTSGGLCGDSLWPYLMQPRWVL